MPNTSAFTSDQRVTKNRGMPQSGNTLLGSHTSAIATSAFPLPFCFITSLPPARFLTSCNSLNPQKNCLLWKNGISRTLSLLLTIGLMRPFYTTLWPSFRSDVMQPPSAITPPLPCHEPSSPHSHVGHIITTPSTKPKMMTPTSFARRTPNGYITPPPLPCIVITKISSKTA